MQRLPNRICQFVPSVAPGDGVTTSAFFIQQILSDMGIENRIFSHRPPFEFRQLIEDIHLFNDDDYDLILIHHSMGHDLDFWIEQIKLPRVLVYHNITPAEYFAADSGHHFYAVRGKRQLEAWPNLFTGAIADSDFNAQDLVALGYSSVETIPLLVDLNALSRRALSLPNEPTGKFILSVGRVVRNKRPHLMIEGLALLNSLKSTEEKLQLVIAGDNSDELYSEELSKLTEKLGLGEHVRFVGKVTDNYLGGLYSRATALWCTSEHEGFCMPLVEACFYGLPIVAMDHPAVTDTLGTAGLIVASDSPTALAAATDCLLTDTALAEQVAGQGAINLQRFDREGLTVKFKRFLNKIHQSDSF